MQHVGQAQMLQHGALGLAGRARGVNNVSKVVQAYFDLRGRYGHFADFFVFIQQKNLHTVANDTILKIGDRNNMLHVRIVNHVTNAFGRVGRVERQISGSGFQNAQNGLDHLR